MKFIMPRDRTVVSKFGRSFEFVKGEPLHVPNMCWDEVIAAGAVPEEALPDDAKADSTTPQGAERTALLVAAIKAMVVKGERSDFTASGAPQAAVLSAAVGFAVDAKERDAAWVAAQNDAV